MSPPNSSFVLFADANGKQHSVSQHFLNSKYADKEWLRQWLAGNLKYQPHRPTEESTKLLVKKDKSVKKKPQLATPIAVDDLKVGNLHIEAAHVASNEDRRQVAKGGKDEEL